MLLLTFEENIIRARPIRPIKRPCVIVWLNAALIEFVKRFGQNAIFSFKHFEVFGQRMNISNNVL